jgi:hypothetical protein
LSCIFPTGIHQNAMPGAKVRYRSMKRLLLTPQLQIVVVRCSDGERLSVVKRREGAEHEQFRLM